MGCVFQVCMDVIYLNFAGLDRKKGLIGEVDGKTDWLGQ